jgi:predicted dehydrogenase
VIEISCTEAMLKVLDRRQLFRSAPGERRGQWQEVPLERVDPITDELSRFIECIERDSAEPVTPEHARHIVAALTACEESSRTGREVQVL